MRRIPAATLVAAAVALSACSSGSSSSGSGPTGPSGPTSATTTSAGPASDWPTYHRTNDRAGAVSGFPRPGRLSQAWQARLDGAVYAQPLVIGSGADALVVAATENDTVYGLDLASGRPRWSRHLGTPASRSELPCGNVDPLGITGTPAYDQTTGLVYLVTETTGGRHDLVALNARDGTTGFVRNLDVTNRDPRAEQERSAVAVANGRVYLAFGGLFGDCGNYVGYVTAVATNGTGAVLHYEVPTERQGGIWAPSGPAVSGSGEVYVAVGNGASHGGSYDGSDSVLRLTPDLSSRLSFFAPKDWGSENAEDADLGSTGPLLLPDNLVLVAGKTGDVYLLDAHNLGGIGGAITSVGGCRAFGGSAFASGAAYIPCTSGVRRVDVRGRSLVPGWQAAGITGSPVVGGNSGGDVVWALDTNAGTLHALDAGSGRDLASVEVGDVNRFASPVLTGRRVLVATLDGVTAVDVG